MGSLALSLTGVASNWLVPQSLIQVSFAQGVLLGDPSTPKVLIMGVKSSAGSATADTQVYGPEYTSDEASVIALFGTGSAPHRAWKRFTKFCRTAPIYMLAVTESAGVQASGTITFATAATAAGSVKYTVCGELIEVAFQSGAAFDTGIAEDFKLAINAKTHLPITAARTDGVVTVTYRTKGTIGNWVRHRATITAGAGTTVAVNAATLASGATDEVYTTALATILATKYDYIVPCISPTATSNAAVALFDAQLTTQAYATSGIRQQFIGATAASLSNMSTYVVAYNNPRMQFVWQENSEFEPYELAAEFAAIRYNYETGADPGVSYDGYGSGIQDAWDVPAQYSTADRPTAVEINTALGVGATPIATDAAGNTYLVMSCTAAGADPRIRDTAKVTVSDAFAADLEARASWWARSKLADDEADGAKPYPTNVLTPTRLKDLTIVPLLRDYRDASLLVNVDGTAGSIAATATGIDPTVTTRINARIPIEVTPLNHQMQFLINEVSSG
jgi:phage tail sheath gpL-like